MILYTDKTLDKVIEQANNSIVKLSTVKPTDDFTLQDIENAIFFIKRFQEECISEKHRREREERKESRNPMFTKVYIKSEDFRDKAWGIYKIDDETELVLEMTHGYSDLYYRNAKTHDVLTEELFFEEPDRNRINDYCRKMHGIEFVTTH